MALKIKNLENGNSADVYALMDTGSDRDVIDEGVASELGLHRKSKMMNVCVLGGKDLGPRELAEIEIRSMDGKYQAYIENALIGNLLTCNSDVPPAKMDLTKWKHIEEAQIPFININSEVRMIISVDHCESLAQSDPKKRIMGPPHAVETDFGWTIFGQDKNFRPTKINMARTSDEALQEKLDRIFFHDFTGVSEEEMG